MTGLRIGDVYIDMDRVECVEAPEGAATYWSLRIYICHQFLTVSGTKQDMDDAYQAITNHMM